LRLHTQWINAELGFGNAAFFSTEIENNDGEYRIPKFILPKKIKGCYLRFWIFKKVIILSTDTGFKVTNKDRNRFKILFGISGSN